MIIRRYLGNNTQEAMLKIKMDLGSEAMILNTRKVRKKGLKGIFSKPMIEVLAAVDSEYSSKKDKEKVDKNLQNSVNDNNYKNYTDKKEEKIILLENRINRIETSLNKIYQCIQYDKMGVDAVDTENEEQNSNMLDVFYNNLVDNEVEPEVARKIISMANANIQDASDVNSVAVALLNTIKSVLGKPCTIKFREDGKPTVVIFVGPTGVGKTTTIAKLAANYSLSRKKNVGLITADTYRIAAVEQLKTYAEILGVPLLVAYSVKDIHEHIAAYSDKDLILIDTTGRNHRNKSHFEELKAFIEAVEADEIYLLLSATTGISTCRNILHCYSFLKEYKLIITKLDEALSPGIILNARFHSNMGLSFITDGQSVPDDIEVADTDKLSKMLLGSIVK